MERNDAEKVAYEAARNEALYRVRLRENLLMFYLAAVFTIMGVAFGDKANVEIMLVIPILGLSISLLFSQHTTAIATLAHFCRFDLSHAFNETGTPQWDSSEAFKESHKKQLKLRSYASYLIILTPGLISLVANYRHALDSSFPMGPAWWLGSACIIAACIDLKSSIDYRRELYRRWRDRDDKLMPNKSMQQTPSAPAD